MIVLNWDCIDSWLVRAWAIILIFKIIFALRPSTFGSVLWQGLQELSEGCFFFRHSLASFFLSRFAFEEEPMMKQKINVLLVMMSKLKIVSGMAYFYLFFDGFALFFCAHACHRRSKSWRLIKFTIVEFLTWWLFWVRNELQIWNSVAQVVEGVCYRGSWASWVCCSFVVVCDFRFNCGSFWGEVSAAPRGGRKLPKEVGQGSAESRCRHDMQVEMRGGRDQSLSTAICACSASPLGISHLNKNKLNHI